MKAMSIISALIAAITIAMTVPTASALDVPELTGPINDAAGILTPEQKTELDQMLRANEGATSNQIVLLSVKSLEGDALEEYAHKVLRAWKLGDAKRNNGILFLIVVAEDHRRIETGYGAEGALPDGKAGEILRSHRHFFKEKKYYEGAKGVLSDIIAATKGEYVGNGTAGGQKVSKGASKPGGSPATRQAQQELILLIVLAIATACLASAIGKLHFLFGGAAGAIGSALLAHFYLGGALFLALAAVFGFFAGMVLSKLDAVGIIMSLSEGSGGGSGWDSSSSSSDSSSESSSYSGGGGGGGGGGASD